MINTEISRKLAALALALSINGLMIGAVAYLFNGQLHDHTPVLSLAVVGAAPQATSQS
jgi:hypothetical protein